MYFLQLCKKQIFLKIQKLSSIKVAVKKVNSLFIKFIEYLYFFDLKYLFTIFLFFSEIRIKMYTELDEFKDVFVKIWQFKNWNFFVRITSDQYVHYFNDHSMFSLNFVKYFCFDIKCFCHQSHRQENVHHFDQILKIIKNYRFTRSFENSLKTIIIKI